MTTIMDCIEEIPSRLKNIIDSQEKLFKVLSIELNHKKYSKIVIVASGSSNNAAFAVLNQGKELLDKEIELIYPNVFVNGLSNKIIKEDILYIFISQTGRTKLVLEGIQKVNASSADSLSITEDLDSPVAKAAKISIEMGSGKEAFIFRTIGYSASLLTLSQVFLYIAKTEELVTNEEIAVLNQDVLRIVENLPTIHNETLEWFNENEEYLISKTSYIFSGAKDLWPVAVEADIKFMEMLPVLSNSFELEELIHGPQNMFKKEYLVFLLLKENIEKNKALNIAEFIQSEVGEASIVVTDHEVQTPHLQITSVGKWYYNLEYITVFQILAYKLGLIKGRDYTQGVYPNVTKYINKSVK